MGNEWIILNKESSLNGSITYRKFRAPPAIVSFICLPPWCSLSESPSRSSVLLLYPGCKKLRVTSPLLIVLIIREGSHWVLSTLLFILGLRLHSIQWEWGNVGSSTSYSGFGHPINPFPLDLCLSSSHLLLVRILSGSRLSLVRHGICFFLGKPVITWCDVLIDSTTSVEKHQSNRTLWRIILSPFLHQKLSRCRGFKWVHKPPDV